MTTVRWEQNDRGHYDLVLETSVNGRDHHFQDDARAIARSALQRWLSEQDEKQPERVAVPVQTGEQIGRAHV